MKGFRRGRMEYSDIVHFIEVAGRRIMCGEERACLAVRAGRAVRSDLRICKKCESFLLEAKRAKKKKKRAAKSFF